MKQALTIALEAVLDGATVILLGIIAGSHRWLDIALWFSTAIVFAAAIWMRSRRRNTNGG